MSIQASDTTLQYLVSSTSLRNRNVDVTERYIDSEQIPFIVVPGRWQYGQVSLRDYAYVYSPTKLNIKQEALNGPRGSFAIVADTGPRGKFGEGSIALHQMLVFGELRAPPTYQKVATGARHPEQAQIFHPYQDRGDGDIRAKAISIVRSGISCFLARAIERLISILLRSIATAAPMVISNCKEKRQRTN